MEERCLPIRIIKVTYFFPGHEHAATLLLLMGLLYARENKLASLKSGNSSNWDPIRNL